MILPSDSQSSSFKHIAAQCQSAYGLFGSITRLPGENENYQLVTEEGQHYILKLSGASRSIETLKLEQRILEGLDPDRFEFVLPKIIHTVSGDAFSQIQREGGASVQACMQTCLEGTAWGEAGLAPPAQLRDMGVKLGQMDLALSSLHEDAAHRTHQWDLCAASQHREKLGLLDNPFKREIVEWMLHFYVASALPHLAKLPHSLIHGDVNDENLLVKGGKVVGLLDFSDTLFNPAICELAIALAYAMLDQPEPLSAGAEVVAGYHSVKPLTPPELEVLYPLTCGRLCTTILIAAERRRIDPEHPTWFSTEERAWFLMEQLYPIDPIEVRDQLCSALALDVDEDPGDNMEELLQRRRQFLSPSLSIAYEEPLKIVRGSGQFLYDDRGKPYLDLVNNVCHVGHCHPHVVEAGRRQMAQLNTNTRYLYDGLTDYAERLVATLPDPLEVCFFVNSGSEANELALRLAESYTGRRDFLVIEGAYHGHTGRLIDLSPYKFMGKGGKGEPAPWVHVVPIPDGYRGKYQGQERNTGEAYGDEVGVVIESTGAEVAAFIAESLLGCGGQIIPPEGYFERAFEHVRAAGGLRIIDEVQVGFARTGTHFWAFEQQGVIPDIVVMGKPIGNGHPMAAVVTTRQIADSFANGMEFFSTFGGNPVSCAIGMAVLDVIEQENLQQHALELGNYFLEGFRRLMGQHKLIGDVRGAGLFLGVELVQDRNKLTPATDEADILVNRARARGILLSTDGPYQNVLKIKPPMVLTRDDVDMVFRVIDDELGDLQS